MTRDPDLVRESTVNEVDPGGPCVSCGGSTRRHVEMLPRVVVLLCLHCEERITSSDLTAILIEGFAAA